MGTNATMPDGRTSRYGRLVRFGIIGVFNTALDFALLFLFVYVFGLGTYLGNILSTGICLVVSFLLNRRWTFRSEDGGWRQFALFLAVTLFGLWVVQTLLIWGVTALVAPLASGPLVLLAAKAVATVGSLTWNYVLYSTVVFRVSPEHTR